MYIWLILNMNVVFGADTVGIFLKWLKADLPIPEKNLKFMMNIYYYILLIL